VRWAAIMTYSMSVTAVQNTEKMNDS